MTHPKYFAVNEAIENQIKSIKKAIYLSMNGICSEKFNEAGIKYNQMYGVSWNRICEIAENYEKSYELAERLWLMPIRETKLIATLLCPPEEMSPERLKEWCEGISTIELGEIFSFALLRKTSLKNEILDLELSENSLIRLTAYHTIARIIDKLEESEIKTAIERINIDDLTNVSAFRAIDSIITNAICVKSMNIQAKKIIEKAKEKPHIYCKYLINNIEELLQSKNEEK